MKKNPAPAKTTVAQDIKTFCDYAAAARDKIEEWAVWTARKLAEDPAIVDKWPAESNGSITVSLIYS